MSKISLFKNISKPSNPEDLDLIEYLSDTRDGKWRDIVTECRNIKDKEERDIFKQSMPTATLSGVFSYRKNDSIVTHSEYIAMDLDYVDNLLQVKKLLEVDRYVFSVFQSTSGYGLRVLFKIEPERHEDAHDAISTYLFDNYGVMSDTNGVSISKPYCVSYDPFLFLNFEEVPVFKKYLKKTVYKKTADFVHTTSDFDSIIKQITGKAVSICENYFDWVRIGLCFADEFGESGRSYFHQVSQFYSKYKEKRCDKQYDYSLKHKASGGKRTNISTFYYLAKHNNINICSEQTKLIIRTTKNYKKAGLKPKQIIDNLLKNENISGADDIVNKIFESGEDSDKEEESILHALELYISNSFQLKMNSVTGYLEQNSIPLSGSDLNTIFISAKKMMPKLDYPLMIRLLKSDFIESYNPFFRFFESDGIPVRLPAIPLEVQPEFSSPLIDTLASCIKNDNPGYTLYFTRKWFVSIVSAAHGVHSPLLHCLLGPPETGKTEFYRRLLPTELVSYYAESKLDKGKDDEILMTQYLLIMDDELGGKSKTEANKIKNITSAQYWYVRRPYGEHNEKLLRLAVLCGTSNLIKIINDPTPNRRIIPIEVDDIDRELYNSINKKDLLLEAYRLYKEGFDWRVTRKDMSFLNEDSDRYEHVIKERELIERFYEPGDDVQLSSTDILVELELATRQKINPVILYRELEKAGFILKSRRINSIKVKKSWGVTRLKQVGGIDSLPF